MIKYLVIEPEAADERIRIFSCGPGCYQIGASETECDIALRGPGLHDQHATVFVDNEGITVQSAAAAVVVDGAPLSDRHSLLLRLEHNLLLGTYLMYVASELDDGADVEDIRPRVFSGAKAAPRRKPSLPVPGASRRTVARSLVEDTIHLALKKRYQRAAGAAEGRFCFPAMPPIAPDDQDVVDNFIYGRIKPLFDKLIQERSVKAEETRAVAEEVLTGVLNQQAQNIPPCISVDDVKRHCIAAFMEYGPLQTLLGNESVTEVMVNGPNDIFTESRGKLTKSHLRFWNETELRRVIEKMVAITNRHIDEQQPYQDTRLEDGSRVNIIIRPLALTGDSITIRKFPNYRLYIDDLVGFNALSEEMAEFLRLIVLHKANSIVSGGTGSGKTTLLNVLSSFIPDDERLVSIEDAAELRLDQPNKVSLEAKPKSAEGGRAITIRDLVINALRMRPDRIVVGECRGGETLDMLQAMNTGHEGSLTTLHANSPRDAIGRVETMCLMAGMELPAKAIRAQVVSAVDFIIQQTRLVDGSRKITSIQEIIGMEGEQVIMQEIFKFERLGMDENNKILGRFCATGVVPAFVQELRDNRVEFPLELFAKQEDGV